MKILVLQMARLGDIFQTWPALRALRRNGAQVHILVRPRFRAAAAGCDGISRIHEFKTDEILDPILSHPVEGFRPSLDALDSLLRRLDGERFDRVINLSFSPLSSWIAFDLEMRAKAQGRSMTVAGYTRHADGTLAIPDDASAFFFAQVGYRAQTGATESINRLSLPRLFATIAGVDPIAHDWRAPDRMRAIKPELNLPTEFIALHIGASDEAKTLDALQWGAVAARLVRGSKMSVVLLGAKSEVEKANAILCTSARHGVSTILSLVGRTDIEDLFPIVKKASLLVAGDSALVQIASLTQTKVLNLSSRTVSHWETGPLTSGSRILIYGGAAPDNETIVSEALSMLASSHNRVFEPSYTESLADRIVRGPLEPVTDFTNDTHADFMWQIISAIYMGSQVPRTGDAKMQDALFQWGEVQSIEYHQLTALQEGRGDARQIASVLDRVDQLTGLLIEAEPRLAPIHRWWTTERTRFGPQTREELIENYQNLNSQLEAVLLSLREIEGRRDGHQLDI